MVAQLATHPKTDKFASHPKTDEFASHPKTDKFASQGFILFVKNLHQWCTHAYSHLQRAVCGTYFASCTNSKIFNAAGPEKSSTYTLKTEF